MKFFNKEVKIALVAICGLVILFFGMNFLKGLKLFTPENIYYISFKDISGLSSSSAIYADGFKVGVVRNIIYLAIDCQSVIIGLVNCGKLLGFCDQIT